MRIRRIGICTRLSVPPDNNLWSIRNAWSPLCIDRCSACGRHRLCMPDSPVGEESEEVHYCHTERCRNRVFDMLDLSAQVGAHDDSVILQFMQLLNEDLFAGPRNQPPQLAQANRAIDHLGEDLDLPFTANQTECRLSR